MTVLEVAEALGKGPRTIQRLAERGELPYEDKLPGRTGPYLFNRAVVELFAQQEQRKGLGVTGGLRVLGLNSSRSATRPGVEREAGHPSKPLGVPGSFPAAGDDCGTTTTDA